ncbi:MAG: peptidoglycan bridge formation glycyltransferase FemA/FemB family protein [Chloroflexota bacterium]
MDLRVVSSLDAEPLDNDAWDTFVSASPDGHLLQTSCWGALKARLGWRVERVALIDGESIIAGAQVLYFQADPLRLFTLAYVPEGPVVDWQDEEVVRTLLAALRRAARLQRAFCLKLEPHCLADPGLTATMGLHGFRPSPRTIRPRRTMVIDLDCEEEEILSRFKKKTRHHVRSAARKGVIVREGSASDLPAFQGLVEETASRHGFVAHGAEFYRMAYDLIVCSGHGRFLVATYQDTVLAGSMVFATGRAAWDMYGATGGSHRKLTANHLLQWTGIVWANKRGCLTYDLCGIPDVDEDVLDREFRKRSDWGVYRFKRGFGGRVVRYAGVYDQVYYRFLYCVYNLVYSRLRRRWGANWHRRLRKG